MLRLSHCRLESSLAAARLLDQRRKLRSERRAYRPVVHRLDRLKPRIDRLRGPWLKRRIGANRPRRAGRQGKNCQEHQPSHRFRL